MWICNKKESRSFVEFRVSNFTDIESKIIPFFEKYPLGGVKQLDFESFKDVAQVIYTKGHLTVEGLYSLLEIRRGMNK